MKFHVWIGVLLLMTLASAGGCRKHAETAKADPLLAAYDTEADWTDAQHIIPLSYHKEESVFYQVSGATPMPPAGPSNRSNLTPVPPLLNEVQP